ncbi:telomere zinc finger-associated protein [Rhinatrema bivittatum]|uniref:telomere zinc finger-associated protein n=1 Tax=Rhinatrema bivittatum TaxID=194408 RepID=UPI001127AAF6|nr:telomere zinc finger-associated protein [Rhinatrema bivittatum]XP_029433681.1 telomere zinc finger-associated protein [Rhinatrema bivittatum]XP_029433682.1 telomere zinc finger-associated protein [Rhinatrema bivittatum]XP_029433683.1 telomere zinc finger-associated protein [Rhinatrema bivittatum]
MESTFIQHSVKVLQALNKQREEGRYCDATLEVGSLSFKAHWSILACSSQFFQSLYGDGTSANIILREEFSEVIGLLLDFLYTGDLSITEENVKKVLSAAKELCILEAVDFCQNFAPRGLDIGDQNEDCLVKPNSIENLNRQLKEQTESDGEEAAKAALEQSPAQEAMHSHCTRRTKQSQGPTENAPVRRRSIRRSTFKTSMLKKSDDLQSSQELRTEQKREGTDDSGISNEWEMQVVEVQSGVTAEVYGDIHSQTDEDYIPPKKILGTKRRLCLVKKTSHLEHSSGPRALEGENLLNRKGVNMPVECPTCHKKFLSKYYLKVHNRKHTGEKPFECSKCGKCYFRKDNLLEHEARNCMNRSEQVFTCSLCQEIFKKKMELRVHMVLHTGEMPYKCSSCSQQFMQRKDLQNHMIKLHGAPKPHACSTCGKCFLSRTELRLHEAFKHRGEKLFVCEECGHRASSRNGVQMHIKAKHRNERPFVCEFCHHAFTQKANLNMHLRTHTGEKPFQCHLCGKTFRTQASLDKHNRTHTGERPFSCEFCDQRFTERGPLLRHVASRHQEGRPHFCQICGKSFKAVEQLRVHVRRHKGVRKFECTECGYKFTRQAHLRRHREIHNRVENYNPRQRKLRNLIIEDEKVVFVSVQTQPELEVGSTEVVVESLNTSSLQEELPEQRICTNDSFPDVIEQSLIITATTVPTT